MKRALGFGFLLMGFGFTVTQGLLIRELLVAFFGNELSIGLVLGNWLILEAAGSGLLGRLADRWGSKAASFAILQLLFALFLPLCLYGAYTSRSLVGAIPGEGVGLVPIYWSSFLILAPLALVDGAMFAFGARLYARLTGREARAIGSVYVLEALGAIVGGIVFTYLFIPFLLSVEIALVLSALNLLSAALILVLSGSAERTRMAPVVGLFVVLVLLAGCLGFLLSQAGEKVQHWVASQQWLGQDLVYSENSPYGNVAVVQREAQVTFYADGIPVLSAPVPDVAQVEEIVHLPLLFVPNPHRVLVLSGGVGGVLRELSKYPVQEIDYAELDPLLIEAVQEFPTSLTLGELSDPRVHVESVDGRLLVRQRTREFASRSPQRYDFVIVNLPYPSTLQLNRFYTVEFFQMVQGLMTEQGVLVMGTPGTLTYMSDELRNLNVMAYQTLQEAFPSVRPIPGDVTYWLASPSVDLLGVPVETLVARWEERNLETRLFTPSHIRLRMDQRYLDWLWTSLGVREHLDGDENTGQATLPGSTRAYINRDLHPVGLFYGLSYWNALFSPAMARAFAAAGRLNPWALGFLISGCGLLFLAVAKVTTRGRGAVVPIAIATTGFTGMTADLVFIFSFQTLYGYVYHWIGLLIAAFMVGLSVGALLMTGRLARIGRDRSTLLRLELALVLFWLLVPILLSGLYSGVNHPLIFAFAQAVILLLNALAGFLVGSQFPLANKMWLAGREAQRGTAGVLYASDLVGAFLGAILVSVFLIPVLGILATCILAAILKLVSLLLVAALTPSA